mgnify:CR=1 FL=1|jgi:hypothetical protein
MERLTKYSKQTSHENGICCTHFFGPECLEVGGNCARNCKWEEAAWSRLAAYEDTGLEPATCANYKTFEDEAISKGVTFKRIVALMEADRTGRLVVLPCQVGTATYYIRYPIAVYPDESEPEIKRGIFTLCDLDRVGHSVFLTREEAENALEAMKDD